MIDRCVCRGEGERGAYLLPHHVLLLLLLLVLVLVVLLVRRQLHACARVASPQQPCLYAAQYPSGLE